MKKTKEEIIKVANELREKCIEIHNTMLNKPSPQREIGIGVMVDVISTVDKVIEEEEKK